MEDHIQKRQNRKLSIVKSFLIFSRLLSCLCGVRFAIKCLYQTRLPFTLLLSFRKYFFNLFFWFAFGFRYKYHDKDCSKESNSWENEIARSGSDGFSNSWDKLCHQKWHQPIKCGSKWRWQGLNYRNLKNLKD